MPNKTNILLTPCFTHPHASSGRKLRTLYRLHLREAKWKVVTGYSSDNLDEDIIQYRSFIDKLWRPVSTTQEGHKKKAKLILKKMFSCVLWPDIGIFWSLKSFNSVYRLIKTCRGKVVLVAVCYPFSSLLLCATLKFLFHSRLTLIAHYVDSFYLTNYGNGTSSYYKPLNYISELLVNLQADRIIINDQKKEAFTKTFPQYLHKTVFIEELPNNITVGSSSPLQKPNRKPTKTAFFAGTLYKTIRHPEDLLKVFSKIKTIQLNIAGNLNDCSDIVLEYTRRFQNISYLGMMTPEELNEAYLYSDLLVNIDNSDLSQQAPGKIFEYMQYQKPIINFFKEKSLSGPILAKKSIHPSAFLDLKTSKLNDHQAEEIAQCILELDDTEKTDRFAINNGYKELFKLYSYDQQLSEHK